MPDEDRDQPPPHAGRLLEPEPDAADGLDPAGVAELLAHRGDVGVDRLGRPVPVGVPHVLEDLGARLCTAPGSMARNASRSNSLAVRLTGSSASVTRRERRSMRQRPDRLRRRRCRRRPSMAGPAGDGPDAGDQLADAERLGHVVVGAELEAEHPVELVAARREHDDRHVRRARPQRAAHVAAVHVRQAEVEQHDVDVPVGLDVQRRLTRWPRGRRRSRRRSGRRSARPRRRDRPRPPGPSWAASCPRDPRTLGATWTCLGSPWNVPWMSVPYASEGMRRASITTRRSTLAGVLAAGTATALRERPGAPRDLHRRHRHERRRAAGAVDDGRPRGTGARDDDRDDHHRRALGDPEPVGRVRRRRC